MSQNGTAIPWQDNFHVSGKYVYSQICISPTLFKQVYELTQLEVLKMRDCPIEEIHTSIHRLTRLKTFIMSFCKNTSLPSK